APAHATEGMSISAEGSDTGDDDDGTLTGGPADEDDDGSWTGGPADEDKKQKAEAAGRKAVESKLCGGLEEKIKLPGVKDAAKNSAKRWVVLARTFSR